MTEQSALILETIVLSSPMPLPGLEKGPVLITAECHGVLTLGALPMLLNLSVQKKDDHLTNEEYLLISAQKKDS